MNLLLSCGRLSRRLLTLLDPHLQTPVLVAECYWHQTDFARCAVRKTANTPISIDVTCRTMGQAFTKGLTLCKDLTANLGDLEVEVTNETHRSGSVGHEVRHTDTFAGYLTAMAETKATGKGAVVNVRILSSICCLYLPDFLSSALLEISSI